MDLHHSSAAVLLLGRDLVERQSVAECSHSATKQSKISFKIWLIKKTMDK